MSPLMGRSHPFLFVGVIVITLLTYGIVGGIILILWWLWCRSTRLIVTEDRVILLRGILSKELTELMLRDVCFVSVYQSWTDRLFDVGRVEVGSAAAHIEKILDEGRIQQGYTATARSEISVTGIPNPEKVKEIINSIVKNNQVGNAPVDEALHSIYKRMLRT